MRRADPVAAAATRRGTVLGLTLAEVSLLLCFCLAMVAAAGIAHERALRDSAERAAARSEAARRAGEVALRGLVEAEAARTAVPVGDLWRRLVPDAEIPGEGRDAAKAEVAAKAQVRADPGAGTDAQAKPGESSEGDPGATAADPQGAPAPGRQAAVPARDAPGRPKAGAADPPGLLERAAAALADIGRGLTGRHDWPPIITLSEAAGYRFASGSSGLTLAFARSLSETVVPRLAETARDYDVDVIEVIGHTDGQPVGGVASNLDATLVETLRGHSDPGALRAGDNAGLGLARAATVAAALRRDPRLDRYRIVPLSAGQAVGPDLRLGTPGADARLRRIEIRMRAGPESR